MLAQLARQIRARQGGGAGGDDGGREGGQPVYIDDNCSVGPQILRSSSMHILNPDRYCSCFDPYDHGAGCV